MDRRSRSCVIVVGLLTSLMSLAPDRVSACWRPVRSPSPELPRDRSELPANLQQWLWRGDRDAAYKVLVTNPNGETTDVSMLRAALDPFDMPRRGIVYIEQFQVPEPVAKGSELRFVRCAHVAADGREVADETLLTYTIGSEVKLPGSLGVIAAEQEIGTLRIADPGRCYIDVADMSFARISLDLSETVRPIEGMLRYELRVDDERSWTYDDGEQSETRFGTSSRGPGEDILYVACHGEISGELVGPAVGGPPELERKLQDWLQYLEPGEHRVQMIGRLPDGRALASNTLLVDLQCGAPGAEPREVASYADASAAAPDSVAAGCTVANARASGSTGLLTLMLTCLAYCAARMRCRARIREARRVERCGHEVPASLRHRV